MSDFLGLVGVACIIFAVCAPVAYCTAQVDGRRVGSVGENDLVLACIQAKGEWKAEGWGAARCHMPKATGGE